MSKYFVAGQPLAEFMKRSAGEAGCWVCPDRHSTHVLQRQLGSIAVRKKMQFEAKTMVSINEGDSDTPSVYFTVVAVITQDPIEDDTDD